MTISILSNVLYTVSLYGSIITLFFSLIINMFKIKLFKTLGKVLCRLFIIFWVFYLALNIYILFAST
ncbi:hypothetical protein SAMN02745248_01121 [Hathewaya proteolytica DSM 3090]|uniref:Uncharacterized protein n=1 Tax=Hathewaya proteolytica DSM 3090 TaxID=1121331 RepID=A0A1M6MQQ4_9CLOT|nr:hypothetical protein SAMN02745248_01121 [Hathewaya proteolytica DSM 3090]